MFGYALIGASIGWLLGFSDLSPLTSIVAGLVSLIGALKASAPTIASMRAGAEFSAEQDQSATRNIAALVVALAIGASASHVAHANNWLGPSPEDKVAKKIEHWDRYLKLSKEEVAQRIFDKEFPKRPAVRPATRRTTGTGAKKIQ